MIGVQGGKTDLLSCRCVPSESAEARAGRETEAQAPERCQVHLPFREAESISSKTQPGRISTGHKGFVVDEGQKGWNGGWTRCGASVSAEFLGSANYPMPRKCYQIGRAHV